MSQGTKMKRMIKVILRFLFQTIPFLRPIYETRNTAAPIRFTNLFYQFCLRKNYAHWPIHPHSLVTGVEYINIGIGTAPGISFGNYIFATKEGPIFIGDYTIIAPNVCIAGVNHSLYNYREYESKKGIRIGSYCWIAANCTILPGVTLGSHTIVGANSVVTKSFFDGYCVIGGNPAKVIKKLDRQLVVEYRNEFEYYGYIKKEKFERTRIDK